MMLRDIPDHLQVERIEPVSWVGPVKPESPESYAEIRTLTYKPRQWFGNEVWVLEGMSDSAAMDQLLTSTFNKGRR